MNEPLDQLINTNSVSSVRSQSGLVFIYIFLHLLIHLQPTNRESKGVKTSWQANMELAPCSKVTACDLVKCCAAASDGVKSIDNMSDGGAPPLRCTWLVS